MSRPLRVCFVAYRGNMKCGGQGIYLWFLARELAQLGIEVDVVVGPPYPDDMPFARAQRLPNQELWARWFTRDYAGMLPARRPLHLLTPLHFYELAASRQGFLPEPFAFSCRTLAALAARMRAGERWDLIHDVQCLGYGLLGLRALGLPIVSTVHHPLTVDRRASFVRDESMTDAIGTMKFYPIGMQSFVARRMDRVLTSSEASAREIARDFGVSAARLTNVWNGLDTELYRPDPSVPRARDELLCVGRAVDPNKGIRGLIEALAKLAIPVRLTLVDDDDSSNPVFRWAREAGVADRVHVTGRVETPTLVDLYRRATLVVVPSRYEGFGLPAVEAMACATPVVASASGALPEVLRLTRGGVLVEPNDTGALASSIQQLLEDDDRRRLLGQRGRERVEALLSWPRVARATAAVYQEVLAERRGLPARTTTSDRDTVLRASQSSD